MIQLAVSGDRKEIRKQVINKFLEEEPGTGTGERCARYFYEVERLQDGSRVYLKRPAPLNKGMDFEVHVENIRFRDKGRASMPSHKNIIDDLKLKKNENVDEYKKVIQVINKIYLCLPLNNTEYTETNFNSGIPIEAILKSIKWLFIEQDVTYWNFSGRSKLYTSLVENELC